MRINLFFSSSFFFTVRAVCFWHKKAMLISIRAAVLNLNATFGAFTLNTTKNTQVQFCHSSSCYILLYRLANVSKTKWYKVEFIQICLKKGCKSYIGIYCEYRGLDESVNNFWLSESKSVPDCSAETENMCWFLP